MYILAHITLRKPIEKASARQPAPLCSRQPDVYLDLALFRNYADVTAFPPVRLSACLIS